jgi:hypothetical protein
MTAQRREKLTHSSEPLGGRRFNSHRTGDLELLKCRVSHARHCPLGYLAANAPGCAFQ